MELKTSAMRYEAASMKFGRKRRDPLTESCGLVTTMSSRFATIHVIARQNDVQQSRRKESGERKTVGAGSKVWRLLAPALSGRKWR